MNNLLRTPSDIGKIGALHVIRTILGRVDNYETGLGAFIELMEVRMRARRLSMKFTSLLSDRM